MRQIFFLAILLAPQVGLAQKTDVVYLTNGDRITGKVSEMTQGQMKFETDTMGYVYIRWAHAVSYTHLRAHET